jgi:hypothetical protein
MLLFLGFLLGAQLHCIATSNPLGCHQFRHLSTALSHLCSFAVFGTNSAFLALRLPVSAPSLDFFDKNFFKN